MDPDIGDLFELIIEYWHKDCSLNSGENVYMNINLKTQNMSEFNNIILDALTEQSLFPRITQFQISTMNQYDYITINWNNAADDWGYFGFFLLNYWTLDHFMLIDSNFDNYVYDHITLNYETI